MHLRRAGGDSLRSALRPNASPDFPLKLPLLYLSCILVDSQVKVAIMHVGITRVGFRKWIKAAGVPGVQCAFTDRLSASGRMGFHLDLPHFNAKLWRGLILPLK